MRKVEGNAKSVRQILQGQRYDIDYYQREYRWQRKQIQELVDDLTEQFLGDYSPKHIREDVQKYGHYFLGSIILSQGDVEVFIVDGQQRLTTLTLILINLHRRQGGRADRVKLEDLIYAEKYGKRSFNIAVPERAAMMEAIFQGQTPTLEETSESVQTIWERYQDLEELLPEEIDDQALPYFCDWLIENVHLVEITATTDDDAYTIFETMNDRGLSLAPLDMLKGYLLSNIRSADKRKEAASIWRERIEALRRLGKDEDTDAVKAWLRARYAQSVRERHRGAENRDFERIGTEFHRWVGANAEAIGLRRSGDFLRFINQEMAFFTRQYQRLREASRKPVEGLEPVYHVACFNFTLQYPLLLSPLRIDDNPDLIDRKVRAVARFLDILLARRAANYLSMTYGAMSYAAFLVMREVRELALPELAEVLQRRLEEQGCDFDGTADRRRNGFSGFGLNQWSKRYIKVLLARMTAWIEQNAGLNTTAASYLADGRVRYEIEHIIADHPERHMDQFSSAADFAEYRNRFGSLLLLPKAFNASYGDLPYEQKLPHYLGQNLLARSLHPLCYQRNPGFLRFIEETGLPFQPHSEFRQPDLLARSDLYRQLAQRVWNPQEISRETLE
jgi:uncharacterized protein with ParB-like and HNH nuclease domain